MFSQLFLLASYYINRYITTATEMSMTITSHSIKTACDCLYKIFNVFKHILQLRYELKLIFGVLGCSLYQCNAGAVSVIICN